MNTIFSEKQLAGFRSKLECQVLAPGNQDYDSSQRVWNGMRHPRRDAVQREAILRSECVARSTRIPSPLQCGRGCFGQQIGPHGLGSVGKGRNISASRVGGQRGRRLTQMACN